MLAGRRGGRGGRRVRIGLCRARPVRESGAHRPAARRVATPGKRRAPPLPRAPHALHALLQVFCKYLYTVPDQDLRGRRLLEADRRRRAARVRGGPTPGGWARGGAMLASVVALNVVGWLLLAAAVGGHYHITNTEIFGFGTGVLAYTLGMR